MTGQLYDTNVNLQIDIMDNHGNFIHIRMKATLQIQQGQRLILLRKQVLKITQDQLAKIVGVAQRTIWRYENGQTPIPEIVYTQLELAYPFVNVSWLRVGEGEMFKPDFDNSEIVLYAEDKQEVYKPTSLLDCEKKLSIARAEILSLRAQLSHANLLIQASKNQ